MMSYGPQNCWMQAGEVEVSIQGIQSFNIARTQLEGAPAQLCQHQLGSLGTHLTTLGPMSDIRRACMIQTRGVSINVYIISTSINIIIISTL